MKQACRTWLRAARQRRPRRHRISTAIVLRSFTLCIYQIAPNCRPMSNTSSRRFHRLDAAVLLRRARSRPLADMRSPTRDRVGRLSSASRLHLHCAGSSRHRLHQTDDQSELRPGQFTPTVDQGTAVILLLALRCNVEACAPAFSLSRLPAAA